MIRALITLTLLAALPARAQSPFTYTAKLEATDLRPGFVTAAGIRWECKGDVCVTRGPWPIPGVGACAALAQLVGPIRAYGHPKATLTAEQLTQCNTGLRTVMPKPAVGLPPTAAGRPVQVPKVPLPVGPSTPAGRGVPTPPAPPEMSFGDRVLMGVGAETLDQVAHTPYEPAVAGSSVYVVYSVDNGASAGDVFLVRSEDGGASFATPVNLSRNASRSWQEKVVASGDNVYVLWYDELTAHGDVLFTRSSNRGASFSAVVNLSNSPGHLSNIPLIAASGRYVYVAWTEQVVAGFGGEILVRVSADYGATFGPPVNLSEVVEHYEVAGAPVYWPTQATPSAITAVGDTAYVVWITAQGRFERRGPEVVMTGQDLCVFLRAVDGAGRATREPLLLTRSAWDRVKVQAVGDDVYAIWDDRLGVADGNEDIVFRASRDRGHSFEEPVNLSNSPARTWNPVLTVSGSWVYVAYRDDSDGDYDVLLRASPDGGRSFGPVTVLSEDAGLNSLSPQVAAEGRDVYVVWQQATDDPFKIALRQSHDGGSTFSARQFVSDVPPITSSHFPQAVIGRDGLHVIWADHALGVVYRRGRVVRSP